uniref:Glutathione peroxidase 4a n=1 Tax=Astyanax mexicanus TaxID=7994 RepID=A0A8B9HF00_ASTMX
ASIGFLSLFWSLWWHYLTLTLIVVLFGFPFSSSLQCAQANDWKSAKSIYEFSAKDIDGNEVSLEKYRGFVCIITNVASK